MLRTLLIALLCFSLLPLLGCTDGSLGERVGNSCRDDVDCARGSFCLTGGDYPDGMCTTRCDFDRDCPSFARCVEDNGGICLLECDVDRDCPARYECKSLEREDGPGNVDVCRGD
ncbi:MAG: hypothetical protein ACQEVA_01500 [Myxococcota bacterium]